MPMIEYLERMRAQQPWGCLSLADEKDHMERLELS